MAYTLNWVHDGVIKRHAGELTHDDLLNSTLEIQRSPDFDSLHWVIVDTRDCSNVVADLTALEAVVVADIGASYSNAKIKIAIVTTNPKTLKLAEHYKNAIRDVLPVEIFSTMVQAREWVKLMDGHLNLPKSFSRSKYW